MLNVWNVSDYDDILLLNTLDELEHQIHLCEAKAIFCHDDALKPILNIYKNCPSINTVITLGTKNLPVVDGLKIVKFEEVIKTKGTTPTVNMDLQDIYMLNKSSGTTGLPKGVISTHYSHGNAMNVGFE